MLTHLFVALSTKGFGETTLGLQIARDLYARGHQAAFLVHESSRPLLASTPFECMTVSEQVGPLLPMYLTEMVDHLAPTSIVLSDFFTTDLWLGHHGLDRDVLTRFGLPLVAIDTWSLERTGTEIDIYWRKTRRFEDWTGEIALTIQPAPLARERSGPHVYSCLPAPAPNHRDVRAELRGRLGVGPDAVVVLFCTASWQQTQYACAQAQRVAHTVPRLLARYFERLPEDVHLLHVGPVPYELPLGARYHWLSQLDPSEFNRVLGGADLLLTANISSMTVGKALVSGVPVLAVINSHECSEPEDLAALPFDLDPEDAGPWLRENLPLYRFYMWPVGYYAFLNPLLRGSEYFQTIPTVELLDRSAVVTGIERLARHGQTRTTALGRQATYVDSLRDLPNPADLVLQAV